MSSIIARRAGARIVLAIRPRSIYMVIKLSDDLMTSAVLQRSRLSDRVALELRKLVLQGIHPPGTRLPATKDLAAKFGVTRLTIREALARLEATGLVQSRHGSGTYVLDASDTATLQVLADTLAAGRDLLPDEIRALLEFRAVNLFGFVDKITHTIQPEHLQRLDEIVAEEQAALGDAKRLAALDYRFNEILALASGNLFYLLLLRSVARAHEYLGEIVFRHAGDGSIVIDTHAAVVRALRKGDAAAVRRKLDTYVTGGNEIVAAWLRRKGRSHK